MEDGGENAGALRAFGSQAVEIIGPVPYTVLQAMLDPASPTSRNTAAEYALMLTARGRLRRPAGPSAEPLSAWERELVTLVAQGRT